MQVAPNEFQTVHVWATQKKTKNSVLHPAKSSKCLQCMTTYFLSRHSLGGVKDRLQCKEAD